MARPATPDTNAGSTLRRSLRIVRALVEGEEETGESVSVARLSAALDLEKSQVSRALVTLAEYSIAQRDPVTKRYRLGEGFFDLAAVAGNRRLVECGRPILERLVEATHESAYLSIRVANSCLTVLTITSSEALRTMDWTGRTVPLYTTSAGRALLLDHDARDLPTLSTSPPDDGLDDQQADLERLARALAAGRANGAVVVDGEFEPGLFAVASPVRDGEGRIVAAINVSGPRTRLSRRQAKAVEATLAAAQELGRRLNS